MNGPWYVGVTTEEAGTEREAQKAAALWRGGE